MSELLDKQVNAQKESLKKYFRGLCKLPQAHEKVCDENERNTETNKEKQSMPKNVIHGRKLFIMPIPKAGENNLHELQVNDSGYNEGTICLVNG